jgi:hypothetical protein
MPRLCFHVQAVLVSCQEPRSAWRDAGPAACDSPQPSTRADEPRQLHQAAFHPVKVKMWPGASATAHPRRRTAAGRHMPRAQRGTSCCTVTGASSAALLGGECFASSHFSTNPHGRTCASTKEWSVCLLLQDLVQSCLHGGGGIWEDMCYERRRAEACVD